MSELMSAAREQMASPDFTPRRGGVLQRQCACGQHALGGECEDCKKERTALQRKPASRVGVDTVPPIVYEVLRSPGQPLDPATSVALRVIVLQYHPDTLMRTLQVNG